MRHLRFAAPALAVLLLGMAGCGDDDDDDNNSGTPRPTATRTATRTATTVVPTVTPGGPTLTPTVTATPGGSSGGEETVQKFVSGVLGSIATLADFAGGNPQAATAGRAALQLPPIAVPCPSGGTIQTGCTPGGGGSELSFTFDGCTTSAGGARSFIDGTIAIDSPAGCPGVPLPVGQPFGVTVDARIEASGGGQTVAGEYDVVETVTYNADGSATVTAEGAVDTNCTGAVSFETIEPLVFPGGADCGTGGALRVMGDGADAIVRLTSGGGVEIDYGADGSVDDTYASCTAPALADCR